jgi:hypothetical protein
MQNSIIKIVTTSIVIIRPEVNKHTTSQLIKPAKMMHIINRGADNHSPNPLASLARDFFPSHWLFFIPIPKHTHTHKHTHTPDLFRFQVVHCTNLMTWLTNVYCFCFYDMMSGMHIMLYILSEFSEFVSENS